MQSAFHKQNHIIQQHDQDKSQEDICLKHPKKAKKTQKTKKEDLPLVIKS